MAPHRMVRWESPNTRTQSRVRIEFRMWLFEAPCQ